jgi:CTP-dependent riboflavin kinase
VIELPQTSIVLTGTTASGVGKATGFTQIDWVQAEFERKLGFRTWPGTFNVNVHLGPSLEQWTALASQGGIPIEPPDASACVAACYPVVIERTVRGAIILPHVAGYAADQIEIVAQEHVRQRLGLVDGDLVTLHVLDWQSAVEER